MTEMLLVRDTLAVSAPRIHELAPGKRFELKADEDTRVPHALANRLVSVPGFAVFLEDGTQIQNIETQDSAGKAATIRADQCIANLDELSQEALIARCAKVSDEKFHAKSSRKAMVNLLISAASSKHGAKVALERITPEIDYSADGDAGAFEAVPADDSQQVAAH